MVLQSAIALLLIVHTFHVYGVSWYVVSTYHAAPPQSLFYETMPFSIMLNINQALLGIVTTASISILASSPEIQAAKPPNPLTGIWISDDSNSGVSRMRFTADGQVMILPIVAYEDRIESEKIAKYVFSADGKKLAITTSDRVTTNYDVQVLAGGKATLFNPTGSYYSKKLKLRKACENSELTSSPKNPVLGTWLMIAPRAMVVRAIFTSDNKMIWLSIDERQNSARSEFPYTIAQNSQSFTMVISDKEKISYVYALKNDHQMTLEAKTRREKWNLFKICDSTALPAIQPK
ncbi:hypothetical protein PseudUWO311_20185 [Pseudanabaena sp. UWO311]|uniref:hypothetical protein n=1 Tax=Pseudanabaena sp. UWO311 TaxID=2487337 RepID=UPI0011573AF7|nr:hypothetical protein [Pseudanabaena sp. UWO311]TYQ24103.1 hypothetical protein PseudUWO311_20185 [Pseudanabaena sp. UWO311]